MTEEIIQLPSIEEIKEMLVAAKEDVNAEIEENPELASSTKLIFNLIEIVEEMISKLDNLDNLNSKQTIALAAHLNLLQCILDDFFFVDDSDFFDDEEEGEEIDLDEADQEK